MLGLFLVSGIFHGSATTHCLRKDSGEHTFLSYDRLIKLPLDTEVLDIVGLWLARAAPP